MSECIQDDELWMPNPNPVFYGATVKNECADKTLGFSSVINGVRSSYSFSCKELSILKKEEIRSRVKILGILETLEINKIVNFLYRESRINRPAFFEPVFCLR